MTSYRRPQFDVLLRRLQEPRRFLQVLAGPRQSGKTTLANQILDHLNLPATYVTADEPGLKNRSWLETVWDAARVAASAGNSKGGVLIIDEVQKLPDWSETVKKLWDEDTRRKTSLKILLLGSSPLLLQKGLTESLAGRFELTHSPHWSYAEMSKTFGWNLDQFVYYGGYPGSALLIGDRERWSQYIVHSLIETTISRDVLLVSRVDKPALLRQLFHLACAHSGEIVAYQKLVGQLQDVGNTTTLAHYIDLLGGAGMITGLQKYSGELLRRRGSSPKLMALNTALISAQSELALEEAQGDPDTWGRLVESAIGAHLLNATLGTPIQVFYWREGSDEVDFVLKRGKALIAIEVKSGRRRATLSGMDKFTSRFKPKRVLLVGTDGIPLVRFLATSPVSLFED